MNSFKLHLILIIKSSRWTSWFIRSSIYRPHFNFLWFLFRYLNTRNINYRRYISSFTHSNSNSSWRSFIITFCIFIGSDWNIFFVIMVCVKFIDDNNRSLDRIISSIILILSWCFSTVFKIGIFIFLVFSLNFLFLLILVFIFFTKIVSNALAFGDHVILFLFEEFVLQRDNIKAWSKLLNWHGNNIAC